MKIFLEGYFARQSSITLNITLESVEFTQIESQAPIPVV